MRLDQDFGDIRVEINPGGIAILTLDDRNTRVNTLDGDTIKALSYFVSTIESEPAVRGGIILSAKKDHFCAGANLQFMSTFQVPGEAERIALDYQTVFEQIRNASKPIVAAIHGICIGSGVALALACHYRLVTHHEKTRFWMPELNLVFIPGLGEIQGLHQRVGLAFTLRVVLEREVITAQKAVQIGLADAVLAPADLFPEALALVGKLSKRIKWIPTLYSCIRGIQTLRRIPGKNNHYKHLLLRKARKRVRRWSPDISFAALHVINCLSYGIEHGKQAASVKEAALFGQLICGRRSRKLIKNRMAILKRRSQRAARN